jgi:cytosolic carboxypeptidase protein 5
MALLNMFVVKIVPMLNPDGVARGHFRFDTLGQNLNRHYENPDPLMQPSIYAVKQVIKQLEDEYYNSQTY